MKNNKLTLLAIASAAGLVGAAHGQIAFYAFGSDGSDSIGTANITADDFTVGGAATTFFPNTTFGSDFVNAPYARLNGDWTGTTAALGGFGTFTLTPANGFQIDVTTFEFEVSATAAGPDTIAAEVALTSNSNVVTSI